MNGDGTWINKWVDIEQEGVIPERTVRKEWYRNVQSGRSDTGTYSQEGVIPERTVRKAWYRNVQSGRSDTGTYSQEGVIPERTAFLRSIYIFVNSHNYFTFTIYFTYIYILTVDYFGNYNKFMIFYGYIICTLCGQKTNATIIICENSLM